MSSQANWNSVTGIATLLFSGNLVAIAIAILFTFGVPIALHIFFFQAVASPPSSNFLLLGPSGAGKTAFTTLVGSTTCSGVVEPLLINGIARGQVLTRFEQVAQHPHLSTINSSDRDLTTDCPNRFQSLPIGE